MEEILKMLKKYKEYTKKQTTGEYDSFRQWYAEKKDTSIKLNYIDIDPCNSGASSLYIHILENVVPELTRIVIFNSKFYKKIKAICPKRLFIGLVEYNFADIDIKNNLSKYEIKTYEKLGNFVLNRTYGTNVVHDTNIPIVVFNDESFNENNCIYLVDETDTIVQTINLQNFI